MPTWFPLSVLVAAPGGSGCAEVAAAGKASARRQSANGKTKAQVIEGAISPRVVRTSIWNAKRCEE
jgi:hypothetical protein